MLSPRVDQAGSDDKPASNLVLPKPLKHTGDEQLAGNIDVGSPAGAWGPDDEEKDDWVHLFGMDGARTREGDASPAANLPVRTPTYRIVGSRIKYRPHGVFLTPWSIYADVVNENFRTAALGTYNLKCA